MDTLVLNFASTIENFLNETQFNKKARKQLERDKHRLSKQFNKFKNKHREVASAFSPQNIEITQQEISNYQNALWLRRCWLTITTNIHQKIAYRNLLDVKKLFNAAIRPKEHDEYFDLNDVENRVRNAVNTQYFAGQLSLAFMGFLRFLEQYGTHFSIAQSVKQSRHHDQALLHTIVDRGYPEVKSVLENYSAEINLNLKQAGETALGRAFRLNKIDAAKEILWAMIKNQNFDANSFQNNSRMTALHIASKLGHIPAMYALIQLGADISLQDNYGQSAMTKLDKSLLLDQDPALRAFAMKFLVGEFIKSAQDPKLLKQELDEDRNTALHFAAKYNLTDEIAALLSKKVGAKIKNRAGLSPIDIARERRFERAVDIMNGRQDRYKDTRIAVAARYNMNNVLLNDANPTSLASSRDPVHGCTALHWAVINKNSSLVTEIEKRGGQSLWQIKDDRGRTPEYYRKNPTMRPELDENDETTKSIALAVATQQEIIRQSGQRANQMSQ